MVTHKYFDIYRPAFVVDGKSRMCKDYPGHIACHDPRSYRKITPDWQLDLRVNYEKYMMEFRRGLAGLV